MKRLDGRDREPSQGSRLYERAPPPEKIREEGQIIRSRTDGPRSIRPRADSYIEAVEVIGFSAKTDFDFALLLRRK
jgi:hypothetical protein